MVLICISASRDRYDFFVLFYRLYDSLSNNMIDPGEYFLDSGDLHTYNDLDARKTVVLTSLEIRCIHIIAPRRLQKFTAQGQGAGIRFPGMDASETLNQPSFCITVRFLVRSNRTAREVENEQV